MMDYDNHVNVPSNSGRDDTNRQWKFPHQVQGCGAVPVKESMQNDQAVDPRYLTNRHRLLAPTSGHATYSHGLFDHLRLWRLVEGFGPWRGENE